MSIKVSKLQEELVNAERRETHYKKQAVLWENTARSFVKLFWRLYWK